MKNLTKEIKAYALKNSLEFGNAEPGKILPKLFQHGLEKENIKKIMPKILETIKEINSLSAEEKEKLFSKYHSYVKVREEKDSELQELENVSKKMVFRLAPYPSGALHIGNAKTFILNSLYAEKYGGKTLLVMDDTIGSAEKQIIPESYKLIEDAFNWLKIRYTKPIVYKSDRLKIYYDCALELIKKDKAYVCHCSQEELGKNRKLGVECGCRNFPKDIQKLRWDEMFKMKEGEAVLRIKTNMMHSNPAFRDRVLFKISDREHPRVGKKYRVWPTLEMSWAIDDHLLGITHIIRGIDLQIETEMEKFIWDIFNWKHPETIHTGLVNLKGVGAKISKSKAQEEIKSKKFTGWDDPRTWSIQSLRKRGIRSEAIREFVKEIGLNKQNISAPIENLYSINRKMIDSASNRYSFIFNPIELKIEKRPAMKKTRIPIHPDKPEEREVKVGEIFVSASDCEKYKGNEIRLLHLFNIKLKKDGAAEFTSLENKDLPKINWVSEKVDCEILMPDGEIVKGVADSGIKRLKKAETIQFERFGFVTMENGEGKGFKFSFAHN
ncbi:glutamate--tRNA ligase [Candidatus Pacearchaeota archaeon]|nr:glutamate--tRNA ligase [Candidatus Pacearchaeota archaeon]